MRKKEVEKRVRELWRKERPQQPTEDNMYEFFTKLLKTNPELTIFTGKKGMSDPWQTIHCWLLEEEETCFA